MNEMRSETLEAGVREVRYDKITIKEYAKHPTVVDDFLRRIRCTVFRDLLYVRSLITPDMWAMYKVTDTRDLTEQILLKEKQAALRLIWQKPNSYTQTLTIKADNPIPYETLLKAHLDAQQNSDGKVRP